ncbi:NAD-dependent epimerase/dehydratase family protein [Helicobacter sp.]|uniref:NAD-dependent epimerase/dehydratase family protein n=1 Tax=Helicobacter sp. TaxID=218 RepID=UPI0025C6118B|nr:NAD-dependent epimerase/dehydratase family protein [Helicobacter sp.]MCI5632385.1 NAD-dependent epimerase/dehydratase family protein [Helicobacter sp.]
MKLFELLEQEYQILEVKNLEKLRNKTILITGANGLVGSNLLNYLFWINHSLDLNLRLIGHSFSLPVSWIPEVEMLNGDLNQTDLTLKFDYLIHAATYGQPLKITNNPSSLIQLNTLTYLKLLELSLKNKAKVLFLSSSEVYGEIPLGTSAKESYNGNLNPFSHRALYAESKRLAESISSVYLDKGLEITIARLSMSYGPGIKEDDQRFLGEFIRQALQKGSITMLDRGQAKRQMGFITDIIEMLLNCFLNGTSHLYNIAGKDIVSIAEIATLILNIVGGMNTPNEGNQSVVKGTPMNVAISIEKYLNEFSKDNFVPLKVGILKTIQHQKILKISKF